MRSMIKWAAMVLAVICMGTAAFLGWKILHTEYEYQAGIRAYDQIAEIAGVANGNENQGNMGLGGILALIISRNAEQTDNSQTSNTDVKYDKPVVRDILEKEVDDKYTLSDKLWTYLQNYAAKHKAAGNGFGYGIADPDGVARTLSARYYKDGSEILIAQEGKNPRRLTPRECARLQGFPDSFMIPVSDTQAYKQFGNSVVVPLMADVAGLIVEQLEKMDSKER